MRVTLNLMCDEQTQPEVRHRVKSSPLDVPSGRRWVARVLWTLIRELNERRYHVTATGSPRHTGRDHNLYCIYICVGPVPFI